MCQADRLRILKEVELESTTLEKFFVCPNEYGRGNKATRILNEIRRYAHNIRGIRSLIFFKETSMKNNLPFTQKDSHSDLTFKFHKTQTQNS